MKLGDSEWQNSDGLRLSEGIEMIVRRVFKLCWKKETTSHFDRWLAAENAKLAEGTRETKMGFGSLYDREMPSSSHSAK